MTADIKKDCFENASILITGGTGSFGKKFTEVMLRDHKPARLVIFSRDELKQHEMRMNGFNHPALRYFIGDIRDRERLTRALEGVDYVIHAAAMKQVPACEYNPMEAIMTNVIGGKNLIDASLDTGVRKVMALSTDKAVNPVNLYGATKLCAEKLFVQGNAYTGRKNTRFSCVRYGNVIGSRGSVVPSFKQQRATGRITITDQRMTRFWITLEQAVQFVIKGFERMIGGEVFVPIIPSMRLLDLAQAIAPDCAIDTIGIRPGEKIHETLISQDEGRHSLYSDGLYLICPEYVTHKDQVWSGETLPEGFTYASDNNQSWMTVEELRGIVGEM